MRRHLRKLLRRARADEGMTLVEMSVVVGLLGVVLAAVLSTLNATQANLSREVSRSDSNNQLRLAFESIDREVRSGNVLYDPSAETYAAGDVTPGMSMRIFTQSNTPTRGGQSWCIQWRITSTNQLQERRWVPAWTDANDPSQVTKWRVVATSVTNRTDGIAAFSRAGTATNVVSVRLRANNNAGKGSTVEVLEAVAGRNTQFYPSTTNCGASTPDPSLTNPTDGTKVPPY